MTRPKKPKPRRTRPDAVVGARMAQAREAAGKTQADMAYDLRRDENGGGSVRIR